MSETNIPSEIIMKIEEIIQKESPFTNNSVVRTISYEVYSLASKTIDEKDEEIKKLGEFINDIAKLLGEDNLGLDDLKWGIDDFEEAITQQASTIAALQAENERLQKVVDIVNDRPDL